MPSSWSQSEPREYPPEREGSFLEQYTKWLDLNGLSLSIERRDGKWSCLVAKEIDEVHLEYFRSKRCDSLNDALAQCYTEFRTDNGETF